MRFHSKPVSALVLLGAGVFLLLGQAPGPPDRVEVVVTALPREGADGDRSLAGRLTVWRGPDETTYVLPESGRLRIPVPTGEMVILRAFVTGFWSEPRPLLVAGDEAGEAGSPRDVTLLLRPAAKVAGRLVFPSGEGPVDELLLTLDRARDFSRQPPRDALHAVETCAVEPKGEWRCTVPALPLDLKLRVSGYVSHYLWAVKPRAGETRNLGDQRLERGASVAGWVELEDGGPPGRETRVTLEPSALVPREQARRRGLSRLERQAEVDERGFFHLDAVPPGRYGLRVEKQGYVPVERVFQVLEGREVVVRPPLVLARPVAFELRVTPPRDPYRRPWEPSLLPAEGGEPSTLVGAEGRWKTALAPGDYYLTIRSGRDRYRHTWLEERLTVAPGDPPFDLRLPVVEIVGRVLLGEDPVEAVVVFGPPHGGREIRIDAPEDGELAGYLPSEGEWPVRVYTEETGWRSLPPVDVELADGDRYAELELVIPDTTVVGDVVDENARPVEGARVTGFQTGEELLVDAAFSDEEGQFRLRGLQPGSTVLSAVGPAFQGQSSGTMVTVEKTGETGPVRLVLEKREELRGRVVSRYGPVAGARLQMRLQGLDFYMMEQGRVVTGPDGRFRARVPAGATGVQILVLPPGFAATTVTLPAPFEEEMAIEVEEMGGTLVLEGSLDGAADGGLQLLIQGSPVPLAYLRPWMALHGSERRGDRWVLPQMAPGLYALCPPAPSGETPCDDGVLPPHGELRLGL